MMVYEFLSWSDEGMWTVYSPSVPGVYGVGSSYSRAKKDFSQALSLLLDYLDDVGEDYPAPKRLCLGSLEI